MNNDSLVSVIMTSYNYADYISESIRSVFNQTYTNIELIIVDDGSQDASREIIKEVVADAPVSVKTIFKDNAGQASAFNTAYANISGDIVTFLDCDDTWYPERIRQVVDFMHLFPGGGIYQHQMETGQCLKRGSMISADVFQLWKEWGNGVFNIADSSVGLLFAPFVPTSGLSFTRSLLDKVFPVPEELISCPDAFLTRTSVAYGPLYSIPTTLGLWRDHDSNAGSTQEFSFEYFWLPKVLPALNKYYEDHGLGLTLVYDPHFRSAVPAEIIMSQYYSLLNTNTDQSVRLQMEELRLEKRHPLGRILRFFLSESQLQAVRRLVRR